MACINRYQAGTNATSNSPASRLRAWLRSANRHAVGNCRYTTGRGGAGGRRLRSVIAIWVLRWRVPLGQAAVGQVRQHVKPVLFEDQMSDDHHGLAPAAQVADDIPEPQVGLPVEPLVGLIEQQHIGVVQRARVRLSFCRVPPDRAPAVWSLNCPNRSRSMSSPARFSEASRRAAAKYRRCWPTVRLSLSTGSCGQYPSVPATRALRRPG